MISKVITVLSIALAVSGAPQHQQAAQFPAGVDPSKCPNFPLCDNAALHNQQPQNHWQPQNQWNAAPQQHWQPQPQWNAPAPQRNHWDTNWNVPALNAPSNHIAPTAGGDKFPAGVDPSKCPNFPLCDNAALHNQQAPAPQHWQPQPQNQWNAAPQQHWQPQSQWNAPAPATPAGGDKYPAGVSPHSCPNYPYCS